MSIPRDGLTVTCLSIKSVQNPGNLRAFADIRVGPLVIHGARVIQQPGQQPWVAMPQTQADDGRWFPCLRTDDEDLRHQVRDRVLTAAKSAGVLRTEGAEVAP